jgi:hypothetical protein
MLYGNLEAHEERQQLPTLASLDKTNGIRFISSAAAPSWKYFTG